MPDWRSAPVLGRSQVGGERDLAGSRCVWSVAATEDGSTPNAKHVRGGVGFVERYNRRGHNPHRFDADVIRVFDGANQPATVESDVELPWQIVKRAFIEDNLGELMAEREGVDEFMWVNARRGVAGQIPDVVRAGATG